MKDVASANAGKFQDPFFTATGETRAKVSLNSQKTLWFNTGTLCNIECVNCYIESSPTNDALVYISKAEVRDYLDQLNARQWPVTEIAFTGGEPFMNPDMIEMARLSLERGYNVLILTNAMRPMMRRKMQEGLLDLNRRFGARLTLRISLDHYDAALHDEERGVGSYDKTLGGMKWLRDNGFQMAVAGRAAMAENEAENRSGYAALYEKHGFNIDAHDPAATVLFPEMDFAAEVPEITTSCWGILNKSPDSLMCASSRMVVKRKSSQKPAVLACTLLPYSEEFEMGATLEDAERDVMLNHPHCSKFCVLGGASCSA